MKKVMYILSNIDKSNEFEWVADRMDKSRFAISFVSIHSQENTAHHQFCKERNIPFFHVSYAGKKDIATALWQTVKILRREKPDVVHAHLFEGGLIGITAAFIAGIKKRIYTRHYATQHHEYAPSGVKYDKLVNKLSTQVIATCGNVQEVLTEMEGCPENKVVLIHHGFPLEDFSDVSADRIQAIKDKYQLHTHPVIGVISRYLHLKGIQYIIPAFARLREKYPTAKLVLANAKGEYKSTVQQMLQQLPEEAYVEIAFEHDNAALFKSFDVFVHVPINCRIEAFGQIYIEALAAGIPGVFTLSGVAPDVVKDRENALVVDFENAEQIYSAIDRLLSDDDLRRKIIKNGLSSLDRFTIEQKVSALEKLYEA